MQPHRPTEPIAERDRMPLVGMRLICIGLLMFGCSRPPPPDSDSDDSQAVPDVPVDLPSELTEYEGILNGVDFNAVPSQFWECNSGEKFEITYYDWDNVWKGSCDGVYQRVRGQLDRNFDPPRLLVQETLEERWSTPSDCSFFDEPDYESCAMESHPDQETAGTCSPVFYLEDSCGYMRCEPEYFDATEFAGWKHFDCAAEELATSGPWGECEFVGISDTCLDHWRCWNPAGDMTMPGVCVPYCDMTGEFESPCDGNGTCVRCSSSDRWGLCMTDCSGEACNVDGFC
jgi:hypothetical protein